MDRPKIQRGWMPYTMAAREYIGIDERIMLRAIKSKELPAWEKPRRTEQRDPAKRDYHCYFVNTNDVDAWIRTYWERAFA